jgi:hypothetical protein
MIFTKSYAMLSSDLFNKYGGNYIIFTTTVEFLFVWFGRKRENIVKNCVRIDFILDHWNIMKLFKKKQVTFNNILLLVQ